MCFSGQCEFEDTFGNCTITKEEIEQIFGKFELVVIPCPDYTEEEEKDKEILRKSRDFIKELRKEISNEIG